LANTDVDDNRPKICWKSVYPRKYLLKNFANWDKRDFYKTRYYKNYLWWNEARAR